MKISVQLEPATEAPSDVRYTWARGTEILSAQVSPDRLGERTICSCASVGLEGPDGSWLILDVAGGQIAGVEVAVWPRIRRRDVVTAPADVGEARALVPTLCARGGSGSLETRTRVTAEADPSEQNFHFRLGRRKPKCTVRIARDLLLDVDDQSHITGLWLLNVPPSTVPS